MARGRPSGRSLLPAQGRVTESRGRRRQLALGLALGLSLACRADPDGSSAATLRLDHLQVAGSHNSYHLQPSSLFHPSHAYNHAPLAEQLAGGVRALELDLHREQDGQIYVYHIAGIDPESTCETFVECLSQIDSFSQGAPSHTPIVVWLELKNETGGTGIHDAAEVEPAILEVFEPAQLLTPDFVQAGYASPRERIEAAGWPSLQEVRGKIMFVLLTRGEVGRLYTRNYTSLAGRLMFANTEERLRDPWALVTKLELSERAKIEEAHAAKLLIASNVCFADRAEADCRELAKRAIALGVHMLKDDFPLPVAGRGYVLELPQGSPGCNPVRAPAACTPEALEP